MSIPSPPKDLEGHCSAIVDSTLYVLSPNSFQSLPLKKHAQWSKESTGVPVTGAACVQVGEGSEAYLYVIGGTATDDTYGGLQRYSFSSRSWETLPVYVPVLQGRTQHSAAYLADSQQIVVYAGSQPEAPSDLSSQTFVVSTQAPYPILSYISTAPPTNLPILQPFNTSHAVMVGGSEWNNQIYTFGPYDGWQPLPTWLTAPIEPGRQGTVIDGGDGSKVLEVYDATVSPNSVSQIILLGINGVPAATGQTVGSSPPSRKRKRDLTLDSWPAYNSTDAPTATRTDYSVAQGFKVAVIAGGSSDAPVAIFNQYDNSWIDAGKFFNSKHEQQPLKPTTSSDTSRSTASPTASETPANTITAPIAGNGKQHDRTLRTLGITLGVLCGIAAIFITVLLLLRWRKMKKRKAEGYLDEKSNEGARMSFADRGASFMKEAGGSVNGLPPPNKAWNNSQNASHSSLAIITGRFSNKRNTNGHQPKPSYDSTSRLVRDKNGTAIISEPMELVSLDEKSFEARRSLVPRTEPKPPAAQYGPMLTAEDAKTNDSKERRNRSSGWSKYFATSQPTGPNGLSHIPSAYVKTNTQSDSSMYSHERVPSQPSQIPSSVLVPPLDIDFNKTVDGQRLSHVATGSPSFNDSREDLARRGSGAPEGQKGLIVDPSRPRSLSETISSYNRSTMSSTMTGDYYHDSGATPWTPTTATFKDHLNSRPPSSVYEQRVPSRGKSPGFFPGPGTSYKPQKAKMSHTAAPSSDWATPNPLPGLRVQKPLEDRDSTVTVFPKGVPSAYYAGRQKQQDPPKAVNSDLGWLNLNDSQTRL